MLVSALPAGCSTRPTDACPPVTGVDSLFLPGRVVLVGEQHGTVEGPDAFGRIACRAIAAGFAVTVGLEIPAAEHQAFDDHMRSDGDDAARQSLLASPFWHRESQDGRSSAAMLELVDVLRRLGRLGDLKLSLIDDPNHPEGRDAAMTGYLAAAASDRARLILALTGNFHNRMGAGGEWMGRRLAAAIGRDRIRSVSFRHAGGSAWFCLPDKCGVVRLSGRGAPVPVPTLVTGADASSDDYDGVIDLGPISASPPGLHEDQPSGNATELGGGSR